MIASRRSFLAATAALGAGSLGAGCGGDDDEEAAGPVDPGDADAVRLGIELEAAEEAFLGALLRPGLPGAAGAQVAAMVEDDRSHADALRRLARRMDFDEEGPSAGGPGAPPAARGLRGAVELKELAAAAYLGQVGRVRSTRVRRLLLAIHAVEARHSAALNRLSARGLSPDGPFAAELEPAEARRRLARFPGRGPT